MAVTLTGLGVAVFAFAARTLWDQVGSPTALAVFAALVSMAGIDAVFAWWSLRRPAASVDAPTEAFVGEATPLRMQVSGLRRVASLTTVSMRGRSVVVVVPGQPVEVMVEPPLRGLIHRVIIDLSVSGPIGLFTCHRRLAVPFVAPMHAAPRSRTDGTSWSDEAGATVADPTDARRGGRALAHGITRGIRPYAPGDARRLVHWPATARSGVLSVRELDEPERPGDLLVVLELGEEGDSAEAAAARCRGVVERSLAAGHEVYLATVEPEAGRVPAFDPAVLSTRRLPITIERPVPDLTSVVVQSVAGPRTLHRRLARAGFGPLAMEEVRAAAGGASSAVPSSDHRDQTDTAAVWWVDGGDGGGDDGWRT